MTHLDFFAPLDPDVFDIDAIATSCDQHLAFSIEFVSMVKDQTRSDFILVIIEDDLHSHVTRISDCKFDFQTIFKHVFFRKGKIIVRCTGLGLASISPDLANVLPLDVLELIYYS